MCLSFICDWFEFHGSKQIDRQLVSLIESITSGNRPRRLEAVSQDGNAASCQEGPSFDQWADVEPDADGRHDGT